MGRNRDVIYDTDILLEELSGLFLELERMEFDGSFCRDSNKEYTEALYELGGVRCVMNARDPHEAYTSGKIAGICRAKGWNVEETANGWNVLSHKRTKILLAYEKDKEDI